MKPTALLAWLTGLALAVTTLAAPSSYAVERHEPRRVHRAAAQPEVAQPTASTVVLDGVTVRLRPGTTQVVTVNHRSGHEARVALHVLRVKGWREVRATTDGRTGYGGLVPGKRRRQGTGTTPLGTFDLPTTFGSHARKPAWSLPHRRIREGDFWVQDNASEHYNTYRNIRRGGFRPHTSERLTDFGKQYEYVVVMDYNPRRVRHRGAGIFLHVNGSGATAGCVSAPRRFLKMLMVRLDPEQRPVIAVGR